MIMKRRSMSDNMENPKDERVKINVGGRIFETYASTLRKHPNTLLGAMFHPRNAQLLKNRSFLNLLSILIIITTYFGYEKRILKSLI
jgi:hypothetical protein